MATAGPVRIDRSASGTAAAASLQARAFTSGDTIVIPSDHGPLDRGSGQELLAHELVHVGQQRSLGSALPAEESSAGQALEREAQNAERLVAESRRSSSTAITLPLARRQGSGADSTGVGQDSVVQQAAGLALSVADSGSPGAESGMLDTRTPGMRTSPRSTPQRAPSASISPTAPAAPDPAPGTDTDVDELTRQIYERLRLRLRRELLLDRERGGFLADSR
jgi:hypothetical protein